MSGLTPVSTVHRSYQQPHQNRIPLRNNEFPQAVVLAATLSAIGNQAGGPARGKSDSKMRGRATVIKARGQKGKRLDASERETSGYTAPSNQRTNPLYRIPNHKSRTPSDRREATADRLEHRELLKEKRAEKSTRSKERDAARDEKQSRLLPSADSLNNPDLKILRNPLWWNYEQPKEFYGTTQSESESLASGRSGTYSYDQGNWSEIFCQSRVSDLQTSDDEEMENDCTIYVDHQVGFPQPPSYPKQTLEERISILAEKAYSNAGV